MVNLKELLSNRIISQTTTYDKDLEDVPARRTFVSHERHSKITANHLAERFGIGPERAKATLRATTQRGLRSAILPIGRRYRADRMFGVKRLKGTFATDTLRSTTKSLRSNVASQIYTHKCGFNAIYHLTRANGEQVGYSLSDFIHEYGAPEHLTFDGAAVQVGSGTRFKDNLRNTTYQPQEDQTEIQRKDRLEKLKSVGTGSCRRKTYPEDFGIMASRGYVKLATSSPPVPDTPTSALHSR
jgi:hypothetical protein